ncbi:MAG TPA: hypothetical protein VF230_15820 [Acidimicrobiales bacterium]
MQRRTWSLVAAVALLGAGTSVMAATPASADGPGVGTPWVVSVGDSAISGEAGRWAGNTNDSPSRVDALGSTAYYDNGTNSGEAIAGCHRSKAAEVHIGGGVNSKNLACSGARTYTQPDGENFKPGLDFYSDVDGRKGQALALQEFAAGHNVKAVVVLIGANNYNFADIVQTCVTNWYTSPTWWKNYCHDDADIAANFTSSNVATQTANVKGALLNVRQAMLNAGYADSTYKIIVQTYSSPIPRGPGFRYAESGYDRQTIGGCGVWNADANWANDTVVPIMNNTSTNAAAQTGLSNIVVLDNRDALVGRRLCENTVGLLEEAGVSSWTSRGAADKTEWVSQIRTTSTISGPYQLQEGLHPSYWGQLALRSCLRLAYNAGAPRSGRCVIAKKGVSTAGEPFMALL